MPSSVGVVSVTNNHDGSTVRVTLSGTPSGNLELWACEVADGPEFGCPYSIVSATQFDAHLPARGIWYLWAKDANGFGSQFAAVYMGIGDDNDTDALGTWLQDTLVNNKIGMEAMIRTWYPDTTIKQIHYGVSLSLLDFPSICIAKPVFNFEWAAMAFGQQWNYQFTIACEAQSAEEQNEVPLATRMAEAASHILTRRRYNGPTINGQEFYDCCLHEGNADEVEIPEVGWVAIASLVWTGHTLKQVAGANFGT